MEDPDFSVVGMTRDEWLQREPDEHVLEAAKRAIELPDVWHMIGVFREPADHPETFARPQRSALKVWFHQMHTDLPGRMRLSVKQEHDPVTHNVVRAAMVIYEPKWRGPKQQVAE
jgi:hypothetical protein